MLDIEKIKKYEDENIKGEKEVCDTHYEVGKKIRNTIKELGGIMPEDLEAPEKSLKEIEKENNKFITTK